MITAAAFLGLAALAAVLRLALSAPLNGRWGFPWGTLLVNVTGSAALGLLAGAGPTALVILGTGGLGTYTTFSTFAVEVEVLGRRAIPLAIAYAAGSVVACTLAAWGGLALT